MPDHPGGIDAAGRLLADGLTGREFEVIDLAAEYATVLRIADARAAYCQLALSPAGTVTWEYFPYTGQHTDPAALTALITGILGYRFLVRRTGWPAAAGLVLGALAAALLALWIGENIGLGTYNHLLATSKTGTLFHESLALGAKSALAFWPLLTSAVLMLAESGARRPAASAAAPGPGSPDASGMWTSGPAGEHSP